MVLVRPDGLQSNTDATPSGEGTLQQGRAVNFWIDQHKVNGAEFARFLATTGHEPQEVVLHRTRIVANQDEEIAVSLADDRWRTKITPVNWNDSSEKTRASMNHVFEGQDNLKVSFGDALAYCNWLGKQLPTVEQIGYVLAEAQQPDISGLIEFRCAKNL